jgi:hypothetical protein
MAVRSGPGSEGAGSVAGDVGGSIVGGAVNSMTSRRWTVTTATATAAATTTIASASSTTRPGGCWPSVDHAFLIRDITGAAHFSGSTIAPADEPRQGRRSPDPRRTV